MDINQHNHIYNLAIQMTQEMKSLWRIEKNYLDDAIDETEKVFWRQMMDDKKNHITELKELLKKALA